MKKYLSTILTLGSSLLIAVAFLMPHTANAIAGGLIDVIAPSVFNTGVGWLGNIVLQFTSWAVTIGGLFLSISMNLTLHIKELYQSIPAIESTWVTIRDLSSIFIIFMLLYSAIIMILGVGKGPSFGSLVIKIFIAGMLINFSLFFVRVAVDASNLVSLQFYNAIAPTSFSQKFDLNSVYTDGGLSNIFMQSLKIPKIYDNKSWLKGADTTGAIVLATFGGAILMITAAFSFFAAAIAFTIRTGLLVFIMALSPLFFVAMIFPKVGEKSDAMFKVLKSQLIFMPAYLGLMYVALRVISDQGFMSIFNASTTNSALQSGNAFGFTMAGVVIQYTIAALFINAPLVAAISAGAWGAKWVPQMEGIAKKITGNYGANLGKWAGRNTYGIAASKIAENDTVKRMAAQSGLIGQFALGKVRNVAKSYDENLDKKVKSRTQFADSLGHDKRRVQALEAEKRQLDILKNSIPAGGTLTPAQLSALRAQYGPTVNSIKDAKNIVETRIDNEKNARKAQYAHNINRRSIDTLFTMRTRENKVAAAKIQIPILKDHLTDAKDSLKDTKADIKTLNNAITNAGGTGNAAQQARLTSLTNDEATHLANIDSIQNQIDQLELIS